MAAATLLSLFPKPGDVLALTPEDFGGVIIELRPPLLQNGMFNPAALIAQVGASYRATFCRRGSLFAAAIGYAKNPTSHRGVAMTALEAARLIVFASHLFAALAALPRYDQGSNFGASSFAQGR